VRATLSNSATSESDSAKTGDAFGSGIRAVMRIKSRNGNNAERAGSCARSASGETPASPTPANAFANGSPDMPSGTRAISFRMANRPAKKKTAAIPPTTIT